MSSGQRSTVLTWSNMKTWSNMWTVDSEPAVDHSLITVFFSQWSVLNPAEAQLLCLKTLLNSVVVFFSSSFFFWWYSEWASPGLGGCSWSINTFVLARVCTLLRGSYRHCWLCVCNAAAERTENEEQRSQTSTVWSPQKKQKQNSHHMRNSGVLWNHRWVRSRSKFTDRIFPSLGKYHVRWTRKFTYV